MQLEPETGALIAADIIRGEIARASVGAADASTDNDDRIEALSDTLRENRAGLRARLLGVQTYSAAAFDRNSVPVLEGFNDEYARDLQSALKELARIGFGVFEDTESPGNAGMSLLERY